MMETASRRVDRLGVELVSWSQSSLTALKRAVARRRPPPTLLDEHFRVVGRSKWHESIEDMQKDLPVLMAGSYFILSGCAAAPMRSQFTYELPQFTVDLRGINFEYAVYGLKGAATTSEIFANMFFTRKIGIVNQALNEINKQLPEDLVQNGHYAFVNVVSDIHNARKEWVTRDFWGVEQSRKLLSTGLDVLILRVDVIRIVPELSDGGSVGVSVDPRTGLYPLTQAGRELLARDVVASLQSYSYRDKNAVFDVAFNHE